MANPTSFPTDFPAQSITDLLAFVKSPASADKPKLALDAWLFLGWGAGLLVGQPAQSAAPSGAEPADDAAKLQHLLDCHKGGQAMQAGAIPPWVLPLALKLLQDILSALA